MSEDVNDPRRGEFAARLNSLFASILNEEDENRPYSSEEIARRAGISGAYMSQIRRKLRNPPTPKVARRIELAFGVDEPYLLSEDTAAVEATDKKLATLREMQERGILQFAMRASRLTADGLAFLNEALAFAEERERTPANDERVNDPPA